ncbi:MAG: DNA repair protein RecO [Candidatus Peribacteraceae bacterium]|nr:DNA repair protein RecO [Candidatus Peribacteraceae bacterium]
MHTRSYDAIVLQAHDVGEADRFLILFTRERGKLAARARGVRKIKSRMGGALLPLHRVTVDLAEHASGFLVTGCQIQAPSPRKNLREFLAAEQAIDLLLSLLHDEEPLPEIFESTCRFLGRTDYERHHVLAYTLHLLSLLGVLPGPAADEFYAHFSPDERAFIRESTQSHFPEHAPPSLHRLSLLCRRLVEEQGGRALRAAEIVQRCLDA